MGKPQKAQLFKKVGFFYSKTVYRPKIG